ESKTRPMGRTASGVRGIRLDDDKDEVVGMATINDFENETILVVTENGYGKRSLLEDYRVTNRGGKGVKTINITEKTGQMVSMKNVTDEDDLMIINRSGIAIRMEIDSIRVMGRATQGVRLIRVNKGDEIAAVAKVVIEEEEEETVEEQQLDDLETDNPHTLEEPNNTNE